MGFRGLRWAKGVQGVQGFRGSGVCCTDSLAGALNDAVAQAHRPMLIDATGQRSLTAIQHVRPNRRTPARARRRPGLGNVADQDADYAAWFGRVRARGGGPRAAGDAVRAASLRRRPAFLAPCCLVAFPCPLMQRNSSPVCVLLPWKGDAWLDEQKAMLLR